MPHVYIVARSDTEDKLTVTLDGRFSIDVPIDQIQTWGWLVANAMAVAAGYSCHGPNSRLANPYGIHVVQLDADALDSSPASNN